MKYISVLLAALALLLTASLSAVELDLAKAPEPSQETSDISHGKMFFGQQLFQGKFKDTQQYRYNPDYRIHVGDVISVKLWGAYDFAGDLTVDKQGNIFIPKIGVVSLLGVPNREIREKILTVVKRVFKDNVDVYADVKQYQPITVFVSGAAKNVGLYSGLSTDSVLQFLDKAGGVLPGQGSYRHIDILRNRRVVKRFDLYQFLIGGNVDLFQFRNGDVILVRPLEFYIDVDGEVNRPYYFELVGRRSTVKDVMRYILPKVTANRFIVTTWQGSKQISREYSLSQAARVRVRNGMKLEFMASHYAKTLRVKIEGEHQGSGEIVVPNGTSLYDALRKIRYTPRSDIRNIRLYRLSVARSQKKMIDTMLDDLQAKVFTVSPSTPEEAQIRAEEAKLVTQFIAEARKVQPKGQVILGVKDNLKKVILEEGDTIYIPKRSNVVVVQGRVSIPSALNYKPGYTVDDYIKACGGFAERANRDYVLVVKAGGRVLRYHPGSRGDATVAPGDSILVLSSVGTKNLMLAKDITQIIYQIAVATAAILRI
jgi:protein involved in polysaccharide export with SLBB domain